MQFRAWYQTTHISSAQASLNAKVFSVPITTSFPNFDSVPLGGSLVTSQDAETWTRIVNAGLRSMFGKCTWATECPLGARCRALMRERLEDLCVTIMNEWLQTTPVLVPGSGLVPGLSFDRECPRLPASFLV